MSQYDGSGSLSSWFPSSHQSSVASSLPNGRPLAASWKGAGAGAGAGWPKAITTNLHLQNHLIIMLKLIVHELLECPVCTNSMYPPIHQCHNGHTLFYLQNKGSLNRCLDLQTGTWDIRCLLWKRWSNHLSFLANMHSGCTFNHRYVKSNPREVENATWMLTVFHCFGQYFCLHFEAFQLGMAPVYMDLPTCSWRPTDAQIIAIVWRKELKLRVTGRIWKEQQNPDGGACIPNLCS
ncbi:hypothetical protein Leryth_007146 [Lithospermum erythrorhizon]|nr:hypothetical protein Leryth_007146 [Lithospermum erythrorhizon]